MGGMAEILPEMLKFANVGLVAGRKHYENMVELKRYEEWEKAKPKSGFLDGSLTRRDV